VKRRKRRRTVAIRKDRNIIRSDVEIFKSISSYSRELSKTVTRNTESLYIVKVQSWKS